MATKHDARRKLAQHGQQGNWRFKGLLLAGLKGSRLSGKDIAKAWPTKKSDYRFLSQEQRENPTTTPDRRIAYDEEDPTYRRLSDATKESDWQSTGTGEKSIHLDKLMKRTLFAMDTNTELDVLWREQLLDTVIEGAERAKIARDAATVINVDTISGDHPRGSDEVFAPAVAEGAEIRDDREDYDTVAWDCTKYAQGARVTEEMRDKALVDVIERHIQWLGSSVENALNRDHLTTVVDDTGNADVDTSAESNRDIASVNAGIASIEENDFMPDSMVVHPRYTETLFNSDNITFANQFGDDEGIRDRMVFPLLGLEGFRASDVTYDTANGSNTWDFGSGASAGDVGAVLYDRDLVGIYLYNDVEIKDYEDPIRDLNGVNARLWVDTQYQQPNAGVNLVF